MKKNIAIFLTVFILLCCFTACNDDTKSNNNDNNVSISALETELKGSDDEFKFTINENSNGFSFEYIKDLFFGSDVTYSGSADKKQNVTNVSIVYNNINNDIVTNKSRMITAVDHLILNDAGSLTFEELEAIQCFVDLSALLVALGVDNVISDTIDTMIDIICENKTVEIMVGPFL